MKKFYSDKLGHKYKEVLGNYEPSYNPDHWQRMKEKLIEVKSFSSADDSKVGNNPPSIIIYWMKIAVVVLGFVAISGMIYYLTAENRIKNIHVETKLDERTELTLPDGSIVMLNEMSDFQYSLKRFKTKKEVFLAGEAYFTIIRDVDQPFIIHTPGTLVTVLGTSFNIRAYLHEEQEIIVVSDGTVHASPNESGNESAVILREGERCILSMKSKTLHKTNNTDLNYKSWMTGELNFSNTTLSEVVLVLSKHYGDSIIINDEKLKGRKLSATFKDESLIEVLEILRLTFYLQIEYENEKIILNKQPTE